MMEKQFIITVGREYGSGGHVIAEKIANHYDIPLYDNNILEFVAVEKDVDSASLRAYDEVPRVRLFSRKVKGQSNSMEENVANLQFDYMRRMADEGKSFVVVGRCAENVLKDYKCHISFFVNGEFEAKRDRIMKIFNMSPESAEAKIESENYRRKMYHNYYCKGKWGDSRNYDLSICSTPLGIDGTADVLIKYIDERIKNL